MVPNYPDGIIYMHALKVANLLSGCLCLVLREKKLQGCHAQALGDAGSFSNKVYQVLAIV